MSQDTGPTGGPDQPLREQDVCADPIAQFQVWFAQAVTCGQPEPTAMTLATATAAGAPSARLVLLKDVDPRGFVFYTNYDSRKGREITANPRAALALWWPPLHRQVRVEGTLERVTAQESDAYHASRERGKQLAAWVSRQSQVTDRPALDRAFREIEQRYAGGDVPRPPFWGGYRLLPSAIEFWQGRINRLHDRLHYRRQPDGTWVLQRLAP